MAEMVAATGKSLSEQINDLFRKYGKRVGEQRSISLTTENGKKVRKLIKNPPSQFGGRKVLEVETIDGIKLDFSNDDWILFRLSGTEPLIRCYGEASSKKELERIMKAGLESLS